MLKDKIQIPDEQIDIEALLMGSYIDPTKTIGRPPTILSIKEQYGTQSIMKRVATLGNFSCIIGKAKTKKTFLISIFTASLMLTDGFMNMIYGERPAEKPMILYFDTEQGEYDCHNVIKRIESISGSLSDFKAFNLRQFDPMQRCQIIERALELWGLDTCLVVIDGIADLATGINDEIEATRVATLVLRWSKLYNLHIMNVIHQNKNDDFATGHLGSMVMKKCENIISLKPTDDKATSSVNNDMGRGISFEPFNMSIDWDGMPEVYPMEKSAKKQTKRSFDETKKEDEPF